ncbi:MAG: PSD1 domain-containing protein [Verrucomicrobiaceae bacterium]|nr:PSD1 domain-containing protein [Verrucomicrobiaceae bacterium]
MLMKFLLTLLVLGSSSAFAAGVSFNRDIRPLLSDRCYYCHGTDSNHRKAGLRLDTFEGATADNDGVRALVPGDPSKSEVWLRIISEDEDEVMPPPDAHKPAFTDAEKALIKRWIEEGAKYEAHWAFVAPKRPAVPAGLNAIDHFIGARLQEEGLSFSPEAERGLLLRRVMVDLTGLPPTAEEVLAFEKDASPQAYERAVDRLLKSPRYGERMAMEWLDVARYADTNGYQMDSNRMQWPWRDWVVRAFNDNLPHDRFIIEQIAGDMLPQPTQDQLIATGFNRNHMLNAEGGTIAEENRTKNVFDRVETTGTAFLGLTMNCCQCHDHKFDPLTQRDYYSMYAMFNQLIEPGGVDKRFGKKAYSDTYDNLYAIESPYITLASPEQQAGLDAATKKWSEAKKTFDAAAKDYATPFIAWVKEMRDDPSLIPQRIKDDLISRFVLNAPLDNLQNGNTQRLLRVFLTDHPEWKKLSDLVDQAKADEEATREKIPHVMVMKDEKPRETHILKRGNYETPGDKVEPAVPSFLPKLPAGAKANRMALAQWLVSPEQPLTSRVIVNRYWQMLFGRGLVKTPDDFGLQGALPSHPELLDWLAVEFRESGWDLKRLIKLIVMSRTYRQSAKVTPTLLAKDPENILLARGQRFRIDSRFLRDQALAISGLLVEKQGGQSVMPYQPPGIWEEMSFGKNRYFQGTGADLYRRSLYTFWRRSVAPANFFDVPARQVCVVKPQRTSTPLHALTTLNDPTYIEAARVWADKLHDLPNDTARLRHAYLAATSRHAAADDLASLQRILGNALVHYTQHKADAAKLLTTGEGKPKSNIPAHDLAAWTTVCLTLLNLDDTLNR